MWFEEHPDPANQKTINTAIEKTEAAIDSLFKAYSAKPVQGSSAKPVHYNKDFVIALIVFKRAYVDLLEIVEPLGVRQYGSKALSKVPTELLVPSPSELGNSSLDPEEF